jgi:hypothetical protein
MIKNSNVKTVHAKKSKAFESARKKKQTIRLNLHSREFVWRSETRQHTVTVVNSNESKLIIE